MNICRENFPGLTSYLKNWELIVKMDKEGDKTLISFREFWEEGSHPQQIQSDEMMRQKIEYIHNNPVKAGLCDKPEDYRWSSHKAFLSAQEGLADVGSTLAFFDRDPVRAAAMYREFFKLPLPDSEWALFDKSRSGIIGDKEFRARCRSVKKLQPVQ